MNLINARLRDNLYIVGLSCLALSLVFFCLPIFGNVKEEHQFGLFMACFALTAIYFFAKVAKRKDVNEEDKIHYTIMLLVLSLISAYALNREMSVFDDSANWFSTLLVVSCVNYLAFAYSDIMPKFLLHAMSFVSGVSWIAFVYLSIYLLPLYAFGVAASPLLAVSLHVFVPAFFAYYSLKLLSQTARGERKYWWSFYSGVATAVAVAVIYAIMWNNTRNQINAAWEAGTQRQNGLPTWVRVSQEIPDNFFTRKLLRTSLVYTAPDPGIEGMFWRAPQRNWNETKKHDPLVMISQLFTGPLKLEDQDKISILQASYNLRYEAEDRLWSGNHLTTSSVNTEVRFWPDCNLTYTEKTVTVSNNNPDSWRQGEEAIYSFYMPEGAVVTSLSLWINGKEEKGVLTTKEKASDTYKTIVGVERHDPSLVQWQEGNSVSVRVFPVPAGESRMFKIGITAPLERVSGKLRYDNVYFKGPAFDNATERVLIDFEQPVGEFQMPATFTSMSRQLYERKGAYTPEWNMVINDPGLSKCSFSFDQNTYSLLPYHQKLSAVQIQKIYLDVNQSWSRDEFDKVTESTKEKEVYVYDDAIRKLSTDNKDELWKSLHRRQFSLFPLFEIDDAAHSLVVTKNSGGSPSLDDLDGSMFLNRTKDFMKNSQRINLFDLGTDLSPYLKSLKEFRVFQYDRGNMRQLLGVLADNHFPEDTEDDSNIIIHRSDMVIHKEAGTQPSSGPDHMMRLFNYNHIMQKLGKDEFVDRPVNDSLVDEARKAYVVTPVSSLLVLETQNDYDRFDIKDANNSLKNASLASKGAAPEPHEWVLIIMTVALMVYVVKRNKLRFSK